ncbi:hypothetical protein Lfu02_75910 [Longispora fulva]|nr:hypothetical protein Lfu02_75910 [Longispora fulva]
MLIISALTQGVLWGIGYLAAESAAAHALRGTRAFGGNPATGEAQARELLAQLAGPLVRDARVTVRRSPATTTVTIRATSTGLSLPIEITMTAPTERYMP